jgi:lipopolysaccharide transport system permease protein
MKSADSGFARFSARRRLIIDLAWRDISQKYRGAFLGLSWGFFQPLLSLAVFSTVFGVFLQVRWAGTQNTFEFALFLFCGLIPFNFVSECLQRAPSLILSNPSYVKKIVFPLQVLPWVSVLVAGFQALLSFIVWLLFCLFIRGGIEVTAVLVPIVLLPLVVWALAFGWFFAALGVYVRDVAQFVSILTPMLMFLSPVLYPVDAVPEAYRFWIYLNPVTPVVEQMRVVLLVGAVPDFIALTVTFLIGLLVALLALAWFHKLKQGFADVI